MMIYYVSLQCNQLCNENSRLHHSRHHGIVHSGGVTAHQCHDCGKNFVTKQKLVNHRRSLHTFEKPYICDQCGQGFVRSDKMVVHKRRAHTGEKPFKVNYDFFFNFKSLSIILSFPIFLV